MMKYLKIRIVILIWIMIICFELKSQTNSPIVEFQTIAQNKSNFKEQPTSTRKRVQLDEIKIQGKNLEKSVAEGFRETVINDLAKDPYVDAISIQDQTEALQMLSERRKLGDKKLDLAKAVANYLNVDYICRGEMKKIEYRYILVLQLLEPTHFKVIQTKTLEAGTDELFTLQDMVSEWILQTVKEIEGR